MFGCYPLEARQLIALHFCQVASAILSSFNSTDFYLPVVYQSQGEKRLEEIGRLTSATAKLMTMFEDPWEELTFRNVGNQGRIFNAVEDRFLLCLTHLHGYVVAVSVLLISCVATAAPACVGLGVLQIMRRCSLWSVVRRRFTWCCQTIALCCRYGSWDQVRNSVRRCERFRFDFYLQSCSADALGKR